MSTDLEARLRDLPERLAGLRADGDLAAAVRERHRRHRRLRVTTAAVAVAALLVGTTLAVGTHRGQALPPAAPTPSATATPPPHGPTPTDPHLLRWPTRGPLAGDATERAAVLRDLDTFARGDLSTYLNLRLRPPSQAPTHILWLGPAYPQPLPIRLGPVAVVQQWNGEPVVLVLEKRNGHYRLLGEGMGRYYLRLAPVHVGVLWMPWECTWPGVSCPRGYAGVVLAAPGTERIELARLPDERYQQDLDAADWQDLTVVDGYAVLDGSADWGVLPWLDVARFDGVPAWHVNWSEGGVMKPS